jgi:hypothetical protein
MLYNTEIFKEIVENYLKFCNFIAIFGCEQARISSMNYSRYLN